DEHEQLSRTMEQKNSQQGKGVDDETSLNEQLEVIPDLTSHSKRLSGRAKRVEVTFGFRFNIHELCCTVCFWQVHVQTIGILVAEKSELQAELEKAQQIKSDKAGEFAEKVLFGEIEFNKIEVYGNTGLICRSDMSIKEQNEELGQRAAEQTERMLAVEKERKAARHEITELQQRLEMAELTAQQVVRVHQSEFLFFFCFSCISRACCFLLRKRFFVRDNEQLSRLISELEQRIAVLETSVSENEQAEGERQRLLESAQGERAALGRALSQNRQLKEQLAELQNGFVHMSNENAELGSALHTEQHVKKELGRVLGELRENQAALREQVCSFLLFEKFVFLMAEKTALHDEVEDMDHRCIQLSGETDTIGEYIALYQNQRDIMKRRHKEKEAHIIRLAKDKEEMKAKMGELQELVLCLVSERDEWYASYAALLQAKAAAGLLPPSVPATEEQPPGEELGDVSLPGGIFLLACNDRTTRQIMQLLHEMQNATSGGGPGDPGFNSTCIPFFYRVDEENEVKIMML
uniref:Golgin subfamily A conserved domain-containing protein n=1 Tax=Eptatretus burgeri TaxID=7764 RepID=A0A8C4RBK5_EPTBU